MAYNCLIYCVKRLKSFLYSCLTMSAHHSFYI